MLPGRLNFFLPFVYFLWETLGFYTSVKIHSAPLFYFIGIVINNELWLDPGKAGSTPEGVLSKKWSKHGSLQHALL